jgi:outer membrane receptor protein involved in Fe transport
MHRFFKADLLGPVLLLVCLTAGIVHAATVDLEGVVRDTSGVPVAGAQVVLLLGSSPLRAQTDAQGRFSLAGATAASGKLMVTAPGFSRVELPWSAEQHSVLVILPVSRVEERITVAAASETPPPNLVGIDRSQLETSGALTVDDTLRQIPGFNLFRRTPGWSANPTSQGVSLRGVGANGASRALVLEDGMPANDPFGGWVYWGRFVRSAIDRIDVAQGGESDLYGSEAMGGVVDIIRRHPPGTQFTIDTAIGNQHAYKNQYCNQHCDGYGYQHSDEYRY